MSYSIIYKKAFIKIEESKILPFVLIGDNNLTETNYQGRQVRVKSWSLLNWICDQNGFTNEALIKGAFEDLIKRWTDGNSKVELKEVEDLFGSFASLKIGSKYLNLKAMTSYFVNACKRAPSLDELHRKYGCSIGLQVPYYLEKEIKASGLTITDSEYCKTNEEFLCTLLTWNLVYGNYFNPNFINLGGGTGAISRFIEDRASETRILRSKARMNKVVLHSPIAYALKGNEVSGYFVKTTATGYRYSKYAYRAKLFLTEALAEKYLDKLRYKENFSIARLEDSSDVFAFKLSPAEASKFRQLIDTYKGEALFNLNLRLPDSDFVKSNYDALRAHAYSRLKTGNGVPTKTLQLLGIAA